MLCHNRLLVNDAACECGHIGSQEQAFSSVQVSSKLCGSLAHDFSRQSAHSGDGTSKTSTSAHHDPVTASAHAAAEVATVQAPNLQCTRAVMPPPRICRSVTALEQEVGLSFLVAQGDAWTLSASDADFSKFGAHLLLAPRAPPSTVSSPSGDRSSASSLVESLLEDSLPDVDQISAFTSVL